MFFPTIRIALLYYLFHSVGIPILTCIVFIAIRISVFCSDTLLNSLFITSLILVSRSRDSFSILVSLVLELLSLATTFFTNVGKPIINTIVTITPTRYMIILNDFPLFGIIRPPHLSSFQVNEPAQSESVPALFIILITIDNISEDATIRYDIILNGVLTGASFTDVDTTNSGVQIDASATSITGGLIIDSGFVTGARDRTESGHVGEDLMSKLFLSNDVAGTSSDILSIVISIINSAGTASDCAGSFTWKEER